MFGIDDAAAAALITGGISGLTGLLGAGASLLGGKIQGDAAKDAAKIQSDAANNATQLQKQQYDQQRSDLAPWRQVGEQALGQISQLSNDPNYFRFDPSQFQTDPGYQFRLKEGLKAVQNSAATRGGLLSGATMKSMNNFAQGEASQEYQNAFNRYQTERMARLNSLQSLAGVGQTAVSRMGDAGQTYASNAGNLVRGGANALAGGYTGAANAAASGYVGASNNLNAALASGYNNYQNQLLLNKLLNKTNSTPAPAPGSPYSGYDSHLG